MSTKTTTTAGGSPEVEPLPPDAGRPQDLERAGCSIFCQIEDAISARTGEDAEG